MTQESLSRDRQAETVQNLLTRSSNAGRENLLWIPRVFGMFHEYDETVESERSDWAKRAMKLWNKANVQLEQSMAVQKEAEAFFKDYRLTRAFGSGSCIALNFLGGSINELRGNLGSLRTMIDSNR